MRWPHGFLLVCAFAGCSYSSHGSRAHDDDAPASGANAGSAAAKSSAGFAEHDGAGFEDSGSAGSSSTSASDGRAMSASEAAAGGDGSQATSSGGSAGSNATSSAGSSHAGAAGDARGAGSTPPAPEVWIGELWALEPILCGADGTFPQSSAPEAYSERVVLLLDRDSDPAAPTGRIRIGAADLPEAPSPEPNDLEKDLAETGAFTPNDSSYWCATSHLTDGAEYSVLESRRSADRLQFRVAPPERWRAWCESQGLMAPPCRETRGCELPSALCPCGAGGCQPHVGMRVALDFSITGDAMETILQPYETAQIRLQRVQ